MSRMVSAVPCRSSSSQQAEAKERTLSEQSSLPERECFSDEDLDEENSDYEDIVIPKKKQAKKKAQSKRNRRFKAHQIQPKSPIARPKEIAKEAARSASWCASVKAAETEALVHPFSKIIREGTNCILL